MYRAGDGHGMDARIGDDARSLLALDGEIDHRDVFLSEHEKTANQRMCVCVSRVLGTVTLESAYRPEA